MLHAFAETYSLSLQQTLYQMGARVIDSRREIDEIRFSLPEQAPLPGRPRAVRPQERHSRGAVYFAADRPYGLIEATVLRDGSEARIPVDMTNL